MKAEHDVVALAATKPVEINKVSQSISEVTRRAILDFLSVSDSHWAGRLSDSEFLSRIYDLETLPSTDYRFSSAASDIAQHRDYWTDWDEDWIFHDDRFNLLHVTDEQFARFLSETIHPVVREDEEETLTLLTAYNERLKVDGWSLVTVEQLSGRPVYVAQASGRRHEMFEPPTGWAKVDRQLNEVRQRLQVASSEEQFQSVGLLCRETIISVCQEVYDPNRHPPIDHIVPSNTDAKRMLEAFLRAEIPGSSNEEARAHAKAAFKLALALQHRRTADFQMAALCAEATTSVVNLLTILTGRRS